MKVENFAVKHKNKVVSNVDVPLYENLEELVEAEAAETIVTKFNKMNKIDIMGAERTKFSTKKTGKEKRRDIAYSLLTTEEAAAASDSYTKLKELLDSADIQARVDEYLAEQGITEEEDD